MYRCMGRDRSILMKLRSILHWFWLNFKCLIAAFGLTGTLIWLHPKAMLAIYAKWAAGMQAAGAKNIADLPTQVDMFNHILQSNGLTIILFFFIGLVLQAPIVMIFTGIFYGLIAFLAPYTIGKSFSINDWFLIVVEATTLLLGVSLSSALAGELFRVEANGKSLWRYWKGNWKTLLLKPVENWKTILVDWIAPLLTGMFILGGLTVFVAWFETYGY